MHYIISYWPVTTHTDSNWISQLTVVMGSWFELQPPQDAV